MDEQRAQTRADAEAQEQEKTYRRLSDRVERLLMQLVILGLVAVVLVQALLTNSTLRRRLNLLEGTDGYALTETPESAVAASAATYRITVQLQTQRSAARAKLLVGGTPVADFSNGQASATVTAGQQIAVDGSAYSQPLTFRVSAAPGLASPLLGAEVTTRGDQRVLGTAQKQSN